MIYTDRDITQMFESSLLRSRARRQRAQYRREMWRDVWHHWLPLAVVCLIVAALLYWSISTYPA